MTMRVVERMTAPRPPPRILSRKMAESRDYTISLVLLKVKGKIRQCELTKRFVDDDVGQQENHEDPVSTSFQQTHDLGRVFPFLFIS